MSKIIGFNADEQMKLLAGALASRLGYQDVSDLMRNILREKLDETFSDEELAQLTALLSPKQKVERHGSEPADATAKGKNAADPPFPASREAKPRRLKRAA